MNRGALIAKHLVLYTRLRYFPVRMQVGDCIDVCLLVGAVLQRRFNQQVDLVHGSVGDCLHTWLRINGQWHIDPCTDCTFIKNDRPCVWSADTPEYTIKEIKPFNLDDYYPGLTLEDLKQALSREPKSSIHALQTGEVNVPPKEVKREESGDTAQKLLTNG